MPPGRPRIIAFLCHWCSYRAADLMGVERTPAPPGLRCLRVPCSGRVEPEMVVAALRHGADGVLIAGCPPGGCHHGEGNLRALRRLKLLRRLLAQMGVEEERLQLVWSPAADAGGLATAMDRLAKALGPRSPRHAAGDASNARERPLP